LEKSAARRGRAQAGGKNSRRIYPLNTASRHPISSVSLTAAINRAKDAGDIQTLREIAEDPHGFILRQGWATLDFSDEAELAQLRRLHETLRRLGGTGGEKEEAARKGKRGTGEAG